MKRRAAQSYVKRHHRAKYDDDCFNKKEMSFCSASGYRKKVLWYCFWIAFYVVPFDNNFKVDLFDQKKKKKKKQLHAAFFKNKVIFM